MPQEVRVFQRRVHAGQLPEFSGGYSAAACGAVQPNYLLHVAATSVFNYEGIKQVGPVVSLGVDHAHRIKNQKLWMPVITKPGPDGGSPLHAIENHIEIVLIPES